MSGLRDLAARAAIYGFPLVFNLGQVERFRTEGVGALPAAPFNSFSHATTLAGPGDTFVSVNNDTVYSIAPLDLSGGPVRLSVPDADGRYYVLQFVDAWTNNFAYPGRRATGTAAGEFLIAPPGWSGEAPAGATLVRSPTDVATIVGRWAVEGVDDLPAVHALQQAMTLEASGPAAGLPSPAEGVPDDLLFFEQMRTWMRAFPPASRDLARHELFAPLGLQEEESPYASAPAELAEALRGGLADARAQMEAAMRASSGGENGWGTMYHVFDYNLDFFEVGALDDPAWKLPDDDRRYAARALAARAGLWGNHGYEAGYAPVWVDGDGEPLDGARAYTLRFEETPPVDAFWSITMYDLPEFYLVANPIDRYSVGDRTPGLARAEDGSLTIHISHDPPAGEEARRNWLPAPAGPFRPLMRMYQPRGAVFDGSYHLPPILRRT